MNNKYESAHIGIDFIGAESTTVSLPTSQNLLSSHKQFGVHIQDLHLSLRGRGCSQEDPAIGVRQALQDTQELGGAALKHVRQQLLGGSAGPGQLKQNSQD